MYNIIMIYSTYIFYATYRISMVCSNSYCINTSQDIQQGKTLEDKNPSVLRDWVADVWKTGNVLYRCLTVCYTVILIIFMGYAVILVEISNRTRTRMSDGRLADQWLLAALRPAEWILNVPLRRY